MPYILNCTVFSSDKSLKYSAKENTCYNLFIRLMKWVFQIYLKHFLGLAKCISYTGSIQVWLNPLTLWDGGQVTSPPGALVSYLYSRKRELDESVFSEMTCPAEGGCQGVGASQGSIKLWIIRWHPYLLLIFFLLLQSRGEEVSFYSLSTFNGSLVQE